MMKGSILVTFALLVSAKLSAQGVYAVKNIPAKLVVNASVVIRNEELVYEVKDPGNAVMNYKQQLPL